MNVGQVFADRSRRYGFVMRDDLDGVSVITMSGSGLAVEVVAHGAFSEEWSKQDYDALKAADRFLKFSSGHTSNDASAIEYLNAIMAAAPAPAPAPAEPVVMAAPEAFSPSAPVSDPVVAQPTKEATLVENLNADSSAFENATNATPAPAAVIPPTSVAEPVAAPAPNPVVPAVAAVVQPAPAPASSAPAAVAAAPQSAQESALTGEEEGADLNYSVTVNGGTVQVQMGKAKEARPAADRYEARGSVLKVGAVEPVFYVALDNNGGLVGLVSQSEVDRKVVGALAGGWIADGYEVKSVTIKELYKIVGAARKAADPKAAKVDPVEA